MRLLALSSAFSMCHSRIERVNEHLHLLETEPIFGENPIGYAVRPFAVTVSFRHLDVFSVFFPVIFFVVVVGIAFASTLIQRNRFLRIIQGGKSTNY